MTRLYQRLSQKQDDKYHILFEDGIVSLTDKAATKLFGILHLCNQLKLNQNGVMVIGNGENDIEMLSRFNHSVAVLSASNEVKRHAAYTMDIKHRPIFIK
ncbi:MAG: HAD family hydrolase [Prevotellaceae bacterium]|jgi:hydroxymethylpyrimidine pyrophosphatase-like HAD family hydrolase|nr:HAD family hydrolase [Prevotellaceae bacterium]